MHRVVRERRRQMFGLSGHPGSTGGHRWHQPGHRTGTGQSHAQPSQHTERIKYHQVRSSFWPSDLLLLILGPTIINITIVINIVVIIIVTVIIIYYIKIRKLKLLG